ncbi:hypothetical protein ACKGJI_11330 [Sulfurospirillum sp. 1307]
MKKIFLIFILTINLFAWDDALLDAMYQLNRGDASDKQKALILQKNAVINQMRIKGQISNRTYQKAQNYYTNFVEDLGKKVSKQNGAKMDVQPRMGKAFDAGTDSDFITNATSLEQVKAIQNDFNKEFEAHLIDKGLDVPKGSNWTQINDIDFMVDPNGVDEETFKKISKTQNDAYSRADAARYEIKTRRGEQPTPKEIAAYKDEMDDFINKKKVKSIKLSEELMEMKKDPNFNKKGTKEWKQRQLKEAKLQQINAQNSKYQDRSIDANNRLAQALGVDIASSDLPHNAKTRAPNLEVSAQKRAILSATVNASNKHLSSQSKLNEALLLSIQATEEPQNAKEIKRRIVKVTDGLNSSQKGEFLERIKNANGVSDSTVKDINKAMKVERPTSQNSLHVKGSKLAKVGDAFGLVGDVMSINEQLGKASRGEHLLININKKDSLSMKALKGASVALLELAPIPIIDTLENYNTADKKAKTTILKAIQRGEHISPAMITTMVFSDIAGQSVKAMAIDPLLQGKEAIEEGAKTTTTIVENYQNKQVLEKDDEKNRKRFDEYVKRAEKINLGAINTKAKSSNGKSYTILDNVKKGDRLYFYIQRTDTWKPSYDTNWEIRQAGKLIKKYKKISATNANANRLAFTNNMKNGDYQIIFRIFNENGKQMDFTTADVRVNQTFGMSPIIILNSSMKMVSSSAVKKDKKYIFGINPIGDWDSSYTIEWFLNGDKIKSSSADASKLQSVWIHFDDFVGTGRHQISVRAIKKGKIVAHQSVSVNIKKSQKKKMSAIDKLRAKMDKEKKKSQGTKTTTSELDTVFEAGEDSLKELDEYDRQYAEAMASIQRSKEAMARMDREDEEFWSGLAEGFAIAGKAMQEGAREYQKSTKSYQLQDDSWKEDDDSEEEKWATQSTINYGVQIPQSKQSYSNSNSNKQGSCWYELHIIPSNMGKKIYTHNYVHEMTACDYYEPDYAPFDLEVNLCGKKYYIHGDIDLKKYTKTKSGLKSYFNEDYYETVKEFGVYTDPFYDKLKLIYDDESKSEGEVVICEESM